MKRFVIVLGMIFIAVGGLILLVFFSKTPQAPARVQEQGILPSGSEVLHATVIAKNLDTVWGVVFLPDKSMLATERSGKVRLISRNGTLQFEPAAVFDNVREIGEGGLLGITIHPNFATNNYVYLYYTYSENNGNTLNRVVRMTYQDEKLKNEKIIIDGIPGASNHNGGRIKFGPDGNLYITTGDAGSPSQAQDIQALGGKILRVTDEGKPAPNNPFNNPVYSYGHRNPQGLVWDSSGQLWSTEHGRSGILSGFDELNIIEKGKNYGWPVIQGDETKTGMEAPKLHSGSSVTWAPAGAACVGNSIFFGGLRGESLYEAIIVGNSITLKEHLKGEFGRIRDVVLGPDNLLYIATSNKDGRGNPAASDDRILMINPEKL